MLSSRRLAREWALKILYQVDVGKTAVSDAEDLALERLRREFVQRGSRSASGSRAEELALDCLTRCLHEMLPVLRPPFERALAAASARLLGEVPYWQEERLERTLRTRVPRAVLAPPRLLSSQLRADLGSQAPGAHTASDSPDIELTDDERARIARFLNASAVALPQGLDSELKRVALAFAREIAAERVVGSPLEVQEEWLLARRKEFNASQAERWRKIGAIVHKQISDWLRTAGFTVKLVTGTLERRTEIDRALGDLTSGWRMERQVSVDRNILRLAAYEMLYAPGIPAGASINEAVELAKKYSTAESGRFVNGVLGALAGQLSDPDAECAAAGRDDEGMDIVLDIPEITDIEDTDTE